MDTSRLLLGVGGAPSPTADALLVVSSSPTAALTARGFTRELLQAAVTHLAKADSSEPVPPLVLA